MCLSANFPQTKRNQDFLLEAKEASDVQDLTSQLQTGLSAGQKTGSDKSSAGGPAQADGTFLRLPKSDKAQRQVIELKP